MKAPHSVTQGTFSSFGHIFVVFGFIWMFFAVLPPKFYEKAISDGFMAHFPCF